jgi:PAT family beta-lactamase induction signal transducer AmpG
MVGGLQISTTNVGFIYGTVGVILLVIGGLLGGYVISRQGLKKWIFPMALMVNLPNLIYFLFSIFHIYDYNLLLIGIAFDQFGSGFGFTAYLVYMMMISEGEHSTAHYAISTGIMALGMMLPGMFSGYIQEILGYKLFFLWILIATIPSLLIIKFLKIDDNYGKR